MSSIAPTLVPIKLPQVEKAVALLQRRHVMAEVRSYRPFTLPEELWCVQINGRNDLESFILILAMTVSGDALSSSSDTFPSVVDAEDIMYVTEFLRKQVEELEDAEVFLLTLRIGIY
jgi:hypothetical protein